ncbi:winged helix-turn-helix domain-containing protein [Leptodesmis sichuanensis]|uniref:winged helix-turn-helix domain-containing protein n=1 Tax=Leptodesmis sichuanensis TaxID=2906798 RepID=UPI001F34EDFA|nr:winged helix-turn-helix domain-containing protein [Leptodesmis sichuanensis]UIE37349.1 hypothetical protein KIK02_20780 [Leptodesmis sichuanensis A121]
MLPLLKAIFFASHPTLFEQAGISWKKTQKRNPKADPALVEKKTGDYGLVGGASAGDHLGRVGGLL